MNQPKKEKLHIRLNPEMDVRRKILMARMGFATFDELLEFLVIKKAHETGLSDAPPDPLPSPLKN